MPDAPTSPIAPGPDGGCPEGYVLNSVDNLCYLVGPPIKVTATGVSLPDVDPRNAGELSGLGTGDSGLPERWALAHWHALVKMAAPPPASSKRLQAGTQAGIFGFIAALILWVTDKYDDLLALIADFISSASNRNIPGFWKLIGSLISDILQVEVNGDQLFQQMQSRGTLAAMQGVGAGLLDLLVSEFTGTATGGGGFVTGTGNKNVDTGLPEATLTPAGGVKAAQALMGFVLSSAVRQANVEGLSEIIPWHLGAQFEKFSEAMRTNLGIGKMLRFALRPIFQDLVAGPLKWAVNLQYRPKLFNAAEAARAFLAQVYTQAEYLYECALDGYSDKRALALLDQHTRRPGLNELLIARAAGTLSDTAFDRWLFRDGYEQNGADLIRQAHDLEPARRVSLAVAEHFMLEFARGNITSVALREFIDALKSLGFLLTPGEVLALEAVGTKLTTTVKLRPRHLSPGQLRLAYIDGTITLNEFEDHLRGLGYSDSDVQILGIEVLIAAKKAAAAAAKHAAAGKKGAGPATSPSLGTPGSTNTTTTPIP